MKKPMYEIIRKIPIKKLLLWPEDKIALSIIRIKAEKEILEIKFKRADLALKWIIGIKRMKHSKK